MKKPKPKPKPKPPYGASITGPRPSPPTIFA